MAVAVYVVQQLVEDADGDAVWRDAARVEVPLRSQRRTILRAAQGAGLVFPATVRVLDVGAAEELVVAFGEAGPPPLVIG